MLRDKDLKTHILKTSLERYNWIHPGENMLRMASAKSPYVECRSEFAAASVVKLGSSFSSYWYDMV